MSDYLTNRQLAAFERHSYEMTTSQAILDEEEREQAAFTAEVAAMRKQAALVAGRFNEPDWIDTGSMGAERLMRGIITGVIDSETQEHVEGIAFRPLPEEAREFLAPDVLAWMAQPFDRARDGIQGARLRYFLPMAVRCLVEVIGAMRDAPARQAAVEKLTRDIEARERAAAKARLEADHRADLEAAAAAETKRRALLDEAIALGLLKEKGATK